MCVFLKSSVRVYQKFYSYSAHHNFKFTSSSWFLNQTLYCSTVPLLKTGILQGQYRGLEFFLSFSHFLILSTIILSLDILFVLQTIMSENCLSAEKEGGGGGKFCKAFIFSVCRQIVSPQTYSPF